MKKVAINGLGRIGKAVFKILMESDELELVAVNDLVSPENLAYLLKYDTVYGRYDKDVDYGDGFLTVNGKQFKVTNERDPEKLPWGELNVDIVFECTGVFTNSEDLGRHIKAGAKFALLSAPTKSEDMPTVVHGVNKPDTDGLKILSCASCTTNCISPVVEIMNRRIGVKKAIMTTVHAYTSTQALVDSPGKKFRRGRAGAANFIPSSTGAAVATTKAIPELKGRFDGMAVRGPVPVGSIADINFVTARNTSVEELNNMFTEEAQSDRYKGIIRVSTDEIVSSDIIRDAHASIIDLTLTQVVDGDLVKVMSWYDNEWGYANQMVREAKRIVKEI